MKKLITTFIVLALLITPMISTQAANSITERLSGRLLLQVQDGGRIWWVDPVGKDKHEATFENAMDLFRSYALGISNDNLSRLKINIESVYPLADADKDGYTDRQELMNGFNPFGPGKQVIDFSLAKRLAGRFLLQTQDYGRVWYMEPTTLVMYEVKFATLMDLFRGLALGITNKDLEAISQVESDTIDISDWVVQKNDIVGVEVKMPPDYRIYSNTGDFYSFNIGIDRDKLPPTTTSIDIFSVKLLDTNVEAAKVELKKEIGGMLIEEGNTIFIGLPADRLIFKLKNGKVIKNYFISNNWINYQASWIDGNEVLEKIASTLRFLVSEGKMSIVLSEKNCTESYSKFKIMIDEKMLAILPINDCSREKGQILASREGNEVYVTILPLTINDQAPYYQFDNLYKLNNLKGEISVIFDQPGVLTDMIISPDYENLVYQTKTKIVVRNLKTNKEDYYNLPLVYEQVVLGDYRFSPDLNKIAMAVSFNQDNNYGKIYILNLSDGSYDLYKETNSAPQIQDWTENGIILN